MFASEFLYVFLKVMFENVDKQELSNFDCGRQLLKAFPTTIYSFKKLLGVKKDCFKKYAGCTKCHSLYNINACVEKHGGETYSKKCPFIKYPNHPQKHQGKECGWKLMKEIKTTSGNVAFNPQKVYCYKAIKGSLETLCNRPGFSDDCKNWQRGCDSEENEVMVDVYDGNVWKMFQQDGNLFFNKVHNYGLILNVDVSCVHLCKLCVFSIKPIFQVLLG